MATNRDETESSRSRPNVTWRHFWSEQERQGALNESYFCNLPTEILLLIFGKLAIRDLGSVSLTCRSFKMFADLDDIWQAKCKMSTKLLTKSCKHIYMDWIYENRSRQVELTKVEREHAEQIRTGRRCGCGRGHQSRPWSPNYPKREIRNDQSTFQPVGGFTKHPNGFRYMETMLSVNVKTIVPELVSFLEKVWSYFEAQEERRHPAALQQMITRYYRFMQLKALNPPNLLLIPTFDIEIVWQTHLFRPTMYREDFQRLFHRVIDHSLIFTSEIEQSVKDQAFEDTCRLYKERFGEDYCPFSDEQKMTKQTRSRYEHHVFRELRCLIPMYVYWDESYKEFSTEMDTGHIPKKLCTLVSKMTNPFSFTEVDILLDTQWIKSCKEHMKAMINKVPIQESQWTPYFRNMRMPYGNHMLELTSRTVSRLEKSYERFLYMTAKHQPSSQLIPSTYAIDIIRRAHMQKPVKYADDCIRLTGALVDPKPSTSFDEESWSKINNHWRAEFQTDMDTDHLYEINWDHYRFGVHN